MVIGDREIKIIQGDSYRREITIENISNELIEGVYFTCGDLDICRKLDFYDGVYILSFTPQETEEIGKFNGNYDITIKFVGNVVNTIQFRSPINIIPKNNKVTCYG